MAPRRQKLRFPKSQCTVLLLDDRVEYVVGFAIEHDRRLGVMLDINLIELRFALANEYRQLMGRQWAFELRIETIPRPHVAEQEIRDLRRLVRVEVAHYGAPPYQGRKVSDVC